MLSCALCANEGGVGVGSHRLQIIICGFARKHILVRDLILTQSGFILVSGPAPGPTGDWGVEFSRSCVNMIL